MQEGQEKKTITFQYEQVQAATSVTAAAIARLTNPHVLQLVIFKEVTVEVWEVEETIQRKVVSGLLESPVSYCCVLPISNLACFNNPAEQSSPSQLDCLLVKYGLGALVVLEWIPALSTFQEAGPLEVLLNPEVQIPPTCLLTMPLFSCPLAIPYKASTARHLPKDGAQGSGAAKVEGITLVAMSLYQGLLQLLSVEWTRWYPEPSIPHLEPRCCVHFLPLPPINPITSLAVPYASPFIVRGLAFLGARGAPGYGALDLKGRPLLVLLSSQQGFMYHSLRLKCLALDLPTQSLRPGPWEIRNVNPTTTLLIPWSFSETFCMGLEPGETGRIETGLRPGSGVIAVSTASLLFVEASGRRASLPLHLDGFPTCWESLSNSRLVLGDSAGALHVLELSNLTHRSLLKVAMNSPLPLVQMMLHVESAENLKGSDSCGQQSKTIFVTGLPGDSQLLRLTRTPGRDVDAHGTEPCNGETSGGGEHRIEWCGQDLGVESNDLLDSVAPVRDMVVVSDSKHSPTPFLLLACGTSPTSTLRKGSLTATFHVDTVVDAKLAGLPRLMPFREDWDSEYHTHLVVADAIAHVSDVVTLEGIKTEDTFMVGLDRGRYTLAVAAMPGGWFIQVTEVSLRVLDREIGSRTLLVEWTIPSPSPDPSRSRKIHHAALMSEGAVLVSSAAVYSVQLDLFGVPHTVATINRPHQVSALGMFYVKDSCVFKIAGVLIVIVAQWTSNTVHLLSWPNLEDIVSMDPCTAPVRSVAICRLAMTDHLFAGTADGNLVYYELSNMKSSKRRKKNREANSEVAEEQEDIHESGKKLKRKQDLGNKCTISLIGREHVDTPQFTLKHGRVIRVGSSVAHLEFGCFIGEGPNHDSSCRAGVKQEALYLWSGRSLVLLPRQQPQEFEVVMLNCQSHPVNESTRLHTKEHPNGLVSLSEEGQVIHGHLDLSIKLRWKVLKITGTSLHVAHHKGSGCIAIASIEGTSSTLHLIHEESMCQVLAVELECKHFPTALTILDLPLAVSNQDPKPVECIVVATQTCDEQQIKGLLSFFDLGVTYSGEKEVQYKLQLLGCHAMEQPCHSLCMVNTTRSPSTPLNCAMCTLDSSLAADDPLLLDILQSLTLVNKHWSRCCSESESLQDGADIPRYPLVALGFTGRVELVCIFVAASGACMLVVPCVAAALDAPFLPFPGIQDEPEKIQCLEEDLTIATETTREEVQRVPGVPLLSPSSWATTSPINIQTVASFVTPGGSRVTSLMPVSTGTLLVAEMLHGLSVIQVTPKTAQMVQLAWQQCLQPLQAVLALTDDLYLLSLQGHGYELMERNYEVEAAYQIQEKIRIDLEKELMSVPELQDGTSSLSAEAQEASLERLPQLTRVATCSRSSTACHLFSKALSLRSTPLTNLPTQSNPLQSVLTVTQTGEVGTITVTRTTKKPILCNP